MSGPALQPPAIPDSMIAQVLLKLGEISAQIAVMQEQLKDVSDHEDRIRALERFRFTLAGIVLAASAVSATVSTWAGLLLHR